MIRQWFKGKAARPIEKWRKESKRRAAAREFGNRFRDGMSQVLGRTAERGWAPELHQRTDLGPRYLDNAKASRLRGDEFKAGKVGRDALQQLGKDEFLMERGWTFEWYLAPNSRVDKQVAVKMAELQAKYPEQFRVIRVSREQFAQAIELGKEIAKQREIEQQRAVEREKADRAREAREQQLAKAREERQALEAKKIALTQTLEEQAREVNRAWDDGQAVPVEQVRESHVEMSKSLEQIRDAERAQQHAVLVKAGIPAERLPAVEAALEQGRENQRRETVQGIGVLATVIERSDTAAAAERAAAEQAQQQARDREADRAAQRELDRARDARIAELAAQGQLSEQQRLLHLGQAHHPQAAVRQPPGTAPSVERGGTRGPESRGISRDR
ncbi:hypothetical protein [Nocardia brasiliensis]|uniref:hypothetical protein n=1 Tax=Nocardia brasiliensis TaxID=37326 RepID=UPI003D944675